MIKIAFLMFIAFVSVTAQAQEKLLSVDQGDLLVVIVPQHKSPLKIDDAIGARTPDDRAALLYQVRNVGSKPVKTYTLGIWFSDNKDPVITTGVMPKDGQLFQPNSICSSLGRLKRETQSGPLQLSTNPRARLIAFVTISEIIFDDGTRYSSPETFRSIGTHVSRIEYIYGSN